MKVLRVGTALLLGAALLLCAAGTIVLSMLAPRADGRIAGIAINSRDGFARIPRRALDCASAPTNTPTESCSALIDGDRLTIELEYQGFVRRGFEFQSCTARYRGKTASCRAGNLTLSNGIPVYALTSGADLGLSDEALRTVRQRHTIENLHEEDWRAIAQVVATIITLSAVPLMLFAPVGRWYSRAGGALIGGLALFAVSRGALALALLWTGLVD
jgi:hypothetical protein